MLYYPLVTKFLKSMKTKIKIKKIISDIAKSSVANMASDNEVNFKLLGKLLDEKRQTLYLTVSLY